MAQYGWQNTVACVGKWLQSNVWNHLSSGRVWKMTVLCILQKSLLIDFIYLGGGVTVTDGRDNWGKKWILCIILTSCSGWSYWYLLKAPHHAGHFTTTFATAHTEVCCFFLGLSKLRVAGCASTSARHILEIMICRGLEGNGQKWAQVCVTCQKLGWWWVLLLKREERHCERSGGKVCFQCVRLAETACPSLAHEIVC